VTAFVGLVAPVAHVLCLLDDLLERGQFSVVLIRSAEDLTDLSEGKTSSSSLLEQHSGNLHVAEAFWPHLELRFEHVDVHINIE
jgi:hypothetical protein